jgi:alcohol dehydrogenase YqhD (iron-dependent ADH family)
VVVLGWLQDHAETNAARIISLGKRVFPQNNNGSAADPYAEQTISRLREWFCRVNAPVSLHDLGIPVSDIPRIAENSKGLAQLWRLRDYTPERVAAILQRCQ